MLLQLTQQNGLLQQSRDPHRCLTGILTTMGPQLLQVLDYLEGTRLSSLLSNESPEPAPSSRQKASSFSEKALSTYLKLLTLPVAPAARKMS